MKLSAVILTKGEETLTKAIESVRFADEIILVEDINSIQKSKVKSQKYNSKVKALQREMNGDFAAQRNFGMKKASGDWILFLDADEVATKELGEEIVNKINDERISADYIKRRDFFWGREVRHGEVSTVRSSGLIRLVRKGSGRWVSPVHETFSTTGSVGRLGAFIDHYPHPSIKEFLGEVNHYSTLRAQELQKMGKSVGILQIILWPMGKFIVNYFLKLGFLDGPAGFTYAFMMSFHSFLVRAKLYQFTRLNTPQ